MASLRDQLLAKGLVSKKRAQQLDREARQERKGKQAQRRTREEEEEARRAEEAAEAEVAAAQRHEARERARAEREAHELRFRVRDIVRSHRLGGRGPVPFHFRRPESARLGCLWLPEAVARDLRSGRAAIAAWQEPDGTWNPAVVSEGAIRKLDEVAPWALLHVVRDRAHLADPAEGLLIRTWQSEGIGPHRVRDPEELAAWRARYPGVSDAS